MPRKQGATAPSARTLRGRPSYWLYLSKIHCTKTEDWMGADEVYITINGVARWGIVSMNDGDTQNLESTTEPVRFRNSVAIEVWDNDTGIWDSDDKLGHVEITAPDPDNLDKDLVANFRDDGASYDVTYQVSKEGP